MKTGPQVNEITTARSRQNRMVVTHRQNAIREIACGETPVVSVQGYQYLVDLGPGCEPRYHRVNKSKECNCGDQFCEAIEAVRQYLQTGGLRAPDPPGEFLCPICGSQTYRDKKWDGRFTRQPGWRCSKGGLRHFLDAKASRIKKQLIENPWLIPPAPSYPGVRREDLMTSEECEAISRKVYLETGYDPTA